MDCCFRGDHFDIHQIIYRGTLATGGMEQQRTVTSENEGGIKDIVLCAGIIGTTSSFFLARQNTTDCDQTPARFCPGN